MIDCQTAVVVRDMASGGIYFEQTGEACLTYTYIIVAEVRVLRDYHPHLYPLPSRERRREKARGYDDGADCLRFEHIFSSAMNSIALFCLDRRARRAVPLQRTGEAYLAPTFLL